LTRAYWTPSTCKCEVGVQKLHWTEVADRTEQEVAEYISCAVGDDSIFGMQQGGNNRHVRDFSVMRASAYTSKLRRLLRWSCSGPECDHGFGNCLWKWQFCDRNGYVLFPRKFGILSMWREWSTHLANLCTMEYDLRADYVAYSWEHRELQRWGECGLSD
jgi:hypothetical protein